MSRRPASSPNSQLPGPTNHGPRDSGRNRRERRKRTDRQREAIRAGLELGYYEVLRESTHRDVPDRLGCSPSAASEHLQKAEAKLVRVAMGEERS